MYNPYQSTPSYISYNSYREMRRKRNHMLLIYKQDKILRFNEWQRKGNISGIVEICQENYIGNGYSQYFLKVQSGWKTVKLTQAFEGGSYFDSVATLDDIRKSIGNMNISDAAIEEFMQQHFPKLWNEHLEIQASLDSVGDDVFTYEFHNEFLTRKAGKMRLIVNGDLFRGENMDGLVILNEHHYSGRGGGGCFYTLKVKNNVELEEIPEGTYGGNDYCLKALGWTFDSDLGDYIKPEEKMFKDTGNNPFEGLSKFFQ